VQGVVNNLEFIVKKEDSYNYGATKGVMASAALNLIGSKLVKAPASSQ
jgi:hypothetical protein